MLRLSRWTGELPTARCGLGRNSKIPRTSDDVLLLIEVSDSSLEYDLGEKLELYAKAGITDYWVVDLIERAVVVHRKPQRGKFLDVKTHVAGDEVSRLAQPKAVLSVEALFLPE